MTQLRASLVTAQTQLGFSGTVSQEEGEERLGTGALQS